MSFFAQKKEYYEKNAKSDCKECEGKGIIDYHVDPDWMEQSSCYICFPDDRGALAAKEWWKKVLRTRRPQEMSYRH